MMHKKKSSILIVLLAIALAIVAGIYTGTETAIFGVSLYSLYDLGGKIFINVLTLLVVPFVSSSIITGIARIGNEEALGRLGIKMFAFYLGTTLLAILIGLFFVNVFHPGTSFVQQEKNFSDLSTVLQAKDSLINQPSGALKELILQIFPSNLVDILHGQMLGLISFCIIFGYAISKIESHLATNLIHFWQGIFQSMMQIIHLVMKFLPLGVFCLVAKTFAKSGFEPLQSLALFAFTVLVSLAVFMFIALPLLLKLVAGVKPFRHFRAMAPALITAFSTSSSSATLPITIDCAEKRAGVSNRICSLVIPLGTSINLSGSALYECVAAMFIAQVYGIELSFQTQFLVVLLALITSIGVAGIPSASIVAILIILKVMGLPGEGIGLLFAVDRVLDMARTTVNVFSDSCCAVLVACSEGEKGILTKKMDTEL